MLELRSTENAIRLIADLLDVAAIEAGQLRISAEVRDLGALVVDALEMLSPMAAEKGVRLESRLGEGLGAECDRERVFQVLSNLVGNALKFTPRGGSITASACAEGREVHCVVRDTGAGMPRDHLPHIFGRFWQGTLCARMSAGLGLSSPGPSWRHTAAASGRRARSAGAAHSTSRCRPPERSGAVTGAGAALRSGRGAHLSGAR